MVLLADCLSVLYGYSWYIMCLIVTHALRGIVLVKFNNEYSCINHMIADNFIKVVYDITDDAINLLLY